ncbi:MAG: hypothetical protein M3R41_10880 [Pseudomonadota bacterium]|nr:hypothetical protein [Pseudomonadota bacterium]
MVRVPLSLVAAAALVLPALPALAQQRPANPPEMAIAGPRYADIASLALAAPIVADATIRSTSRLKPEEAPDLTPGTARLYVEADLGVLIRGTGALPPRIAYLLDVRLDDRGRAPKLKKARMMLFARATSRPGQLQLVRIDGQRDWTPALDAMTRRIVKQVLAPDAPPAIAGAGHVFYTPGDLPGNGETQIFLKTASEQPISVSVTHTNGERHWNVALSEVVGQATPPPATDSLLWYRLACGLPRTLPPASTDGDDPANSTVARDDYRYVLDALGPCEHPESPPS